jgi:hypothetical protein
MRYSYSNLIKKILTYGGGVPWYRESRGRNIEVRWSAPKCVDLSTLGTPKCYGHAIVRWTLFYTLYISYTNSGGAGIANVCDVTLARIK